MHPQPKSPRPVVASAVSWLLLGSCLGTQAQVQIPPSADPGVIQQREQARELQQRMEEKMRERIDKPVQEPPLPTVPEPAAEGAAFAVLDIQFSPASAILTSKELEDLAATYRGPAQNIQRLRDLVSRINARYRARGVVTAQAMLPAQDVTDGHIQIQLIEGRVGKLRVDGNVSTNESYVIERISLQRGELVNLPQLEQDLIRFNRSNDAQLRADLKPGAAQGETDIGLTLVEPKVDGLRLFADNAGSSATGVGRVGASYMRRSLTGRRDDVYLSLVRSSGNTGAAITYGLPVGRLGTRLSVGYFNDTTKIVSGPIAELHVTGKATAWSLSARHPWFTSADLQLDALASWKQRHTANLIESTQLTASKQHSASVGVEGQWLDARGFWGGSLELASGSNQPVGIESRSFKALRGNLRRTQALTPDWTLNGSLNWQYARVMLLPASEQIQLGGEGSVRGYQPGIYSGDRGWVTNAELQRKIRMNMAPDWSSSVLAFIDHGQVTPFRPDNNSLGSDKLSAVGLGVNLGWKDQLTARLVVGKPVSAPTGVSSGARAHVQVNWTAL